jgi:isopenicillin N synthase-like dioxygenase
MSISSVAATDFDEVPLIAIGALGRGDAAEAETIRQIRHAAERVGFFYIADHGVPAAATKDILEQARRFFDLPATQREAILLTRSPCYRGYLPFGARGDNAARPPDILESFNVGPELGPDAPEVRAGTPLHGPNQWPEGLPGFRSAVLAYYAALETLMRRLVDALALALELPREALRGQYRRPLTQLRLLHYPPQPPLIDDQFGVRAHQDTDFLTILLQDDKGGLEVRNHAGDWILAPPRPGTFVVNVGEMLELVSSGRFPATLHRVINRSGVERYSVPFFISPDFDTVLQPLPHWRDEAQQPAAPFHVGNSMAAFFSGLWPSAGTSQ